MARHFTTHKLYEGRLISRVKKSRQGSDPRKRDLSPTVLDFGPVRFVLARHFGFCYGVENAVEIAYQTLDAHSDRRIFFLSEMIHNPKVNGDLRDRGVRFIFTPTGEQLVEWSDLTSDDIVVVPAFGTTIEMQENLAARGIDAYTYNTTCPFVEKVWKRSAQLGHDDYAVVVHGIAAHEETRATFSHSVRAAPTVVVLNIEEAQVLASIIRGDSSIEVFESHFRDKSSAGFDPTRHLSRIGVVNQTTMLATETREIAATLRQALIDRYGVNEIENHYADTSDTLCYATNENQNATYALIEHGADIAVVVGGYNSSNTSHIVELCQDAMTTYFINGSSEIISNTEIRHFNLETRDVEVSRQWLATNAPTDIVLTCGASCPDAILDEVLLKILSFFEKTTSVDEVIARYPVSAE